MSPEYKADLPQTTSVEEAKPKEIEKKFLIKTLPENIDQYNNKKIDQGYIAITVDGTEVRLRRKGDKYFQTVKSGAGEVRTENEISLSQEQFEALWGATEGKRIEKTRYEIPYNGFIIELDIYHGQLDGLITAEVEFPSEDESGKFIPPDWFGNDVTKDKSYKNQNLALLGLPSVES